MELVPPNRKKITKYTGPTKNRFSNSQSYSAPLPKFSQDCPHNWSFSELSHGKGMGCTAAHFYGGEEIGGADLAQIQVE